MTHSLRFIFLATLGIAACAFAATAQDGQLLAAAKNDDATTVARLLASGASAKAQDFDGSTALHYAARNGNDAMAAALLAAGADAAAVSKYKVTPMSLAAEQGATAIIERLLKAGVDANSTSGDGQTALMSAVLNGKVDAVKMLLSHGASVNATEPLKGQTALMWAAAEGNTKAAEMLVEFGGDISAKSRAGFTPFLFAVLNDQIETAKVLLAHGANVEDKAPDGSAALSMAIINAYFDMAAVLLDAGANPNVNDNNGTPLHSLAWMRRPGSSWEAAGTGTDPIAVPRSEAKLSSLDLAEKLLKMGADPNAKITWKEMTMSKSLGTTRNPPNINLGRHHLSFVGSTPFYNAARNGDPALMRLLVKYGADANIATAVGVTPLMAATCLDYYEGESPGPTTGVPESDRLEAVKLAIELGNDVNAKTHFGDYPMIGSAEFTLLTYPENMDDLLTLGVGDPRWDGMAAIHGAVMCNQPSVLAYLIEKGADVQAKNRLGWTPIMITHGIFMANSKKEFPAARQMLEKALTEQRAAN